MEEHRLGVFESGMLSKVFGVSEGGVDRRLEEIAW